MTRPGGTVAWMVHAGPSHLDQLQAEQPGLARIPSSAAWSGRRPRSTVRTGSVATSNPSSDAASIASHARPLTRTAYRTFPCAAPPSAWHIPLGDQDMTIVPDNCAVTISTG